MIKFAQTASVLFAVAMLVVVCWMAAGNRFAVIVWICSPCVLVLAFGLARSRFGSIRGSIAGACISLLLPLAVCGYLHLGTPRSSLLDVGDWIVAELGKYQRAHGRFPPTLEGGGIRPAWNRFGGWWYSASDDGSSWSMSVGDYDSDGFVYYRTSTSREWGCDS